jgi:hypothetical protein
VSRYVILFRVVSGAVRIERVVYGGRDLPQLFQGPESAPSEPPAGA